jgi:hypothetical protein
MREPKFISREGIPILYVDFSNLKSKEEIFDLIDRSKRSISMRPPKSVLILINLTDMYFNTEVYTAISDCARMSEPYVKACAGIGLSGLMMIFYKGFLKLSRHEVCAFSTEADAVNYLIGHNNPDKINKKKQDRARLFVS